MLQAARSTLPLPPRPSVPPLLPRLPLCRSAPVPPPCCSPAMDDLLSPEELSTWVLQHLKQEAEGALGEPVTGAVRSRACGAAAGPAMPCRRT